MRSSTIIAFLAVLTLAPSAFADSDESSTEEQLVLLNAANKLGDLGQVDRLRRVLDQRGLLRRLPNTLEAALDGRSVVIKDIEAVKEAYGEADFGTALELIEADQERILRAVGSGDLVPALAELSEWRGMIYAAMKKEDQAVEWFRAAYRFNPAWTLEKKYASPSMVALTKRARREVTETGKLKIEADPDDAQVRVDGKTYAANEKIELATGWHYLVVTAKDRAPWADLVEVTPGKLQKQAINLDAANKNDRAATLIDATVTAAPGKARLRESKRLLGTIDGGDKLLVIEDGNDERVTIRLYDITEKKVSKPIELGNNMTSAAITRLVNAALDPDNMISANQVLVIDRMPAKPAIYERWYFWAGVAAIAVGGFAGYQYMTREPVAVRF